MPSFALRDLVRGATSSWANAGSLASGERVLLSLRELVACGMNSEPPLPGRGLSLQEWAALSEDEAGELVDGALTEEEVQDPPVHELAVTLLVLFFGNHLIPRGGFVFTSEVKLAVLPTRGRKADVSAYFPGGHRPPRRGLLRAPPDLLVEVVTPTPRDERRDRVEKMGEYQAFGVRFYWLVDPALGAIGYLRAT